MISHGDGSYTIPGYDTEEETEECIACEQQTAKDTMRECQFCGELACPQCLDANGICSDLCREDMPKDITIFCDHCETVVELYHDELYDNLEGHCPQCGVTYSGNIEDFE